MKDRARSALVERLYDVTEGRILIDRQNISAVAQASLRAQIAIVPQEPVLFHRSLAETAACSSGRC